MANSVVEAVLHATKDRRTREAMLTGAYLESGWRSTAVGDNGSSFGPWQIHLPAHPGVTAAEAKDPEWAAKFMLRGYQAGVKAQPESLWRSNPAKAAERAAVAAERPARPYSATQGMGRVREAYAAARKAAAGGSTSTPRAPAAPSSPGTTAEQAGVFGDAWDAVSLPFQQIGALLTWWWTHKMRIAMITVGSVMIVVGLVYFMKGST